MPIVSILKKASNYILGSEEVPDNDGADYEDNETLFCKNNICVESDSWHYPGYLTVTTKTFIDQYNNAKRPTLMLTWIPNSTLRKRPSAIENSGAKEVFHGEYSIELREIGTDNEISYFSYDKSTNGIIKPKNTNPFLNSGSDLIQESENPENRWEHSGTFSTNTGSTCLCRYVTSNAYMKKDVYAINEINDEVFHTDLTTMEETDGILELQPLLCDDEPMINQKSVATVNITIANPCIQSHHIYSWDTVTATSEKLRSLSVSSVDESSSSGTTPEFLTYKHNLSLPNSANASPIFTRNAAVKCKRFSVDLSKMRSLRLFFSDENCTSGQLVIASRESQYKILHFHHGGLDHLAQVLHQWHCLLHNIKLSSGNLKNSDEKS